MIFNTASIYAIFGDGFDVGQLEKDIEKALCTIFANKPPIVDKFSMFKNEEKVGTFYRDRGWNCIVLNRAKGIKEIEIELFYSEKDTGEIMKNTLISEIMKYKDSLYKWSSGNECVIIDEKQC